MQLKKCIWIFWIGCIACSPNPQDNEDTQSLEAEGEPISVQSSLEGNWQMDVAATREFVISAGILDTNMAGSLLSDDKDIQMQIGPENWSLIVDGRSLVTHEGTFDMETGILHGNEIGGRKTRLQIEFDSEDNTVFWATSLNHRLWPGYKERYVRK